MVSENHKSPAGKNVMEAILARRSVRAYTSAKPDPGTIRTLLEAAVRAPTAMHEEPWAFLVIQNKLLLKRLSDRAKPLFAKEVRSLSAEAPQHSFAHSDTADFDLFHGANTLVVICAKHSQHFAVADCWLAAENMMLVASDLGLGSCVIGSCVSALNTPLTKIELGIPDEYAAVAPIIVGIPSGETAATTRREPFVLSWRQ